MKTEFSYKQDLKLKKLVEEYGEYAWPQVASKMRKFTAEECHQRYQYLCKHKKKKVQFTHEEDVLLEQKVKEYGKRWHLIIPFFKNKSMNDLKNRYYRFIIKQKGSLETTSEDSIPLDEVFKNLDIHFQDLDHTFDVD